MLKKHYSLRPRYVCAPFLVLCDRMRQGMCNWSWNSVKCIAEKQNKRQYKSKGRQLKQDLFKHTILFNNQRIQTLFTAFYSPKQ